MRCRERNLFGEVKSNKWVGRRILDGVSFFRLRHFYVVWCRYVDSHSGKCKEFLQCIDSRAQQKHPVEVPNTQCRNSVKRQNKEEKHCALFGEKKSIIIINVQKGKDTNRTLTIHPKKSHKPPKIG